MLLSLCLQTKLPLRHNSLAHKNASHFVLQVSKLKQTPVVTATGRKSHTKWYCMLYYRLSERTKVCHYSIIHTYYDTYCLHMVHLLLGQVRETHQQQSFSNCAGRQTSTELRKRTKLGEIHLILSIGLSSG